MLTARNIALIKGKKNIIKNINVHLPYGECVGLIGPNGSGKSSLIKVLSFLEQPTEGTIYFENEEIPNHVSLEIRRRIAVVFQEPLLLNTNVFENVAAGLKLRRIPKKEISERVEYWLDAFGISHLMKQDAHSLSGGEAQRVSLARAFALNPSILFLDEPFSALDAPTVEDLLTDLTKVFHKTRITALLVSHNFRDIKRLTTKTLVMLNGEVKAEGPTTRFFEQKHNEEVDNFLAYSRLSS